MAKARVTSQPPSLDKACVWVEGFLCEPPLFFSFWIKRAEWVQVTGLLCGP